MEQKTASDGGEEIENNARDIEPGDRAQAGDLVVGDIVTPYTDDDDANYEVVEIWREEDSLTDPLRVKLVDDEGNEDVVVGTVCRHSLVERAGDSDDNNASTDGGGEVETCNLEVSAETVVNGLKINDRPGERRVVLFRPSVGCGYGEGVLRDIRGQYWDGEAPPQIRPREFVREPVESPAQLRSDARRMAEEEGDDPEESEQAAMEMWEDQVRAWLKDEIVSEPIEPEEETTIIYEIEYVDE